MNKKLISLALMASMTMASMGSVFAADLGNTDLGTADYNGTKIVSTVSGLSFDNVQPGDTVSFSVNVKNTSSKTVYYYMENEVADTLEDNCNGTGGSYSYSLKYNDEVLYANDLLGGGATGTYVGLKQATQNSKDSYFYFATLEAGQSGTVSVTVTLGSDTVANDYMKSLANLVLRFAVEEQTSPSDPVVPTNKVITVVDTGDNTNISMWTIAAGISAVAFILLGIFFAKKEKKEEA